MSAGDSGSAPIGRNLAKIDRVAELVAGDGDTTVTRDDSVLVLVPACVVSRFSSE